MNCLLYERHWLIVSKRETASPYLAHLFIAHLLITLCAIANAKKNEALSFFLSIVREHLPWHSRLIFALFHNYYSVKKRNFRMPSYALGIDIGTTSVKVAVKTKDERWVDLCPVIFDLWSLIFTQSYTFSLERSRQHNAAEGAWVSLGILHFRYSVTFAFNLP